MGPTDSLPLGWRLSYDEVSNNVYKVNLTTRQGLTVEKTGTDLEEIISECIENAKSIDNQVAARSAEQLSSDIIRQYPSTDFPAIHLTK